MNSRCKHLTFDEAELVRRARKGESDAFLDLVKRFDASVFRIARQITQNQMDAENVLFQTFLKASHHLERCPDGAKFYIWLVTIAVNEALSISGGRGQRPSSIEDALDQREDLPAHAVSAWRGNPHELYTREQLSQILDQAMQSLETPYRAVFVLKDIEEMPFEDAAQVLNLSIPAVKRRLLSARLLLREELTRRFRIRPSEVATGQTTT